MVEIVNDTFNVNGIPMRFSMKPGLVTTADEALIFKDRGLVDLYLEHLPTFAPRNVLEFGIFQGGSAVLLATALGLERIACIDICNPLPGLEAFLERHALADRVRCHFNTSQDDRERVRAIVEEVFGDNPLDMVIDDCSHAYELSKKSFEIVFPLLRPGGQYVLEDWAWAHWEEWQSPDHAWKEWSALSNLVFEWVMLLPSTRLIDRIEVRQPYVVLHKSAQAFDLSTFSIDALVKTRGRVLNKI